MLRVVVLFFCFTSISFAQTEFTLSPIVMESAPVEALQGDPILPARTDENRISSASGSIEDSLSNELAVPVIETGAPGGTSQIRGFGRSAEDINVQVFGIPLNPALGGGFSFSVFPQFLWSSFSFQNGPSIGSMDPRAVAGTLNLTPWTSAVLADPRSRLRITSLYSTRDLGQVSVGYRASEVAVIAGYSRGDLQGPSGGLSTRFDGGRTRMKLHLLATDVDATSRIPGFEGNLLTTRIVPVAQLDFDVSQDILLKSSVFFDHTNQRFVATGFPSKDKTAQFGAENAVFWREWRFGLTARRLKLDSEAVGANNRISENQFNLLFGRTFGLGSVLLDPLLQATSVSGTDVFPQASLGARVESAGGIAAYSRASYSRRVPSFQDRYYSFGTFFRGNPDLKPEDDWTGILGTELKSGQFTGGFEGFAQFRRKAQVNAGTTVVNQGNGRVLALLARAGYEITPQFRITNATTLSDSHLDASGSAFPYLPSLIELISLVYQVPGSWGSPRFELEATGRGVGSVLDTAGGKLAGYGCIDFEARTGVVHGVTLGARVENILGREIEVVRSAPKLERAFSFLISGTF